MKKITLIILFVLSSCQSSKLTVSQNEKFDLQARKIISTILEHDETLKKGGLNFHVKFEKLNNNYSIVHVVLNNDQPKNYTKKINYLDCNIYLYIDKISNDKDKLDTSAFFIPDSIMIQLLIHTEEDEILNMKELTLYD